MKKLFLFLLVGIFAVTSTLTVKAQVTVGAEESPVPGAMLQLKSRSDALSQGNANAILGVGFPRVALVVRDQLQPMYSATDAPNLLKEVKMEHTGLVVYNVTEDDNEELHPGLYQWDGTEWTGFAQSTPAAHITFPTDCDSIMVNGDYYNTTPLNSSNYITIPVTVTKTGYYTISAVANPENGYYFSASGTFMSKGLVFVTIPGAGQPRNFTPSGNPGDALTVVCNGDTAVCTPNVFVQDATHKPYFAMSCNSVTVNGVYKKGFTPTTDEKITLRLNVYDGAQGASWSAKTDVIDGLWFEGSGTLGAAGTQSIDLYAQGTSINTAPKTFTITTNSQSTTATCNATVTPVISGKRIIAYGDHVYGFLSPNTGAGCKSMVMDGMNYGSDPNSIVKYEGFDSVVDGGNGNLPDGAALHNVIAKGTGYDIIIIAYQGLITTQSQIDSLTAYVNNGGVLIDLNQELTTWNINLINSIFGEDPITTFSAGGVNIGATCGYLIKMNPGVNDMISNGPFGDVRGSQWGDDTGNTCGLKTAPYGAIIYAGATAAATNIPSSTGAQVTILRHPTKNFFWCGDAGLIAANTAATVTTAFPFKVAARTINGYNYLNFPFQELYGSPNQMNVCNSMLFANVMAWAITQAEQNGINSGQ